MKTKQGFAYWIPAKLVEDGDHLKALLYGLIYSLSDDEGCSWASNKYMAKKLGRKDASIITAKLRELAENGWIKLEQEKAGNDRKIYLNLEALTLRKKPEGATEISVGYPTEISVGSNITPVSNETEYNPLTPKGVAAQGAAGQRPLTDLFYKTINPNIKWENKTNIRDEEFLLKKHGLEKCVAAINFVLEHWGKDPMLPTITTPSQLREKMAALIKFKLGKGTASGKKMKIWVPTK